MARYEDLTGRRFGLLTVIKKADEPVNRYAAWRCRCDCGGEITVSSKHLKRETKTNCGCIPKKTAHNGTIPEDLTGRVFGRLEVLSRDRNRGDRTCWLCRCACGALHSATAHDLKSGHVKSCGCASHENSFRLDLTDRRFGHLTALRPLEERTRGGSVIWECLCDCGKITKASADSLISGNTASCGCRREEIAKELPARLHMIDGTILELLRGTKARSDSKTGIRGVSLTGNQTYRAQIRLCGQRYDLGRYKTEEEAVQVRQKAARQLYDPILEAHRRWSNHAETHKEWADEHPLRFAVIRHGKTDFDVLFDGLPDDTLNSAGPKHGTG